jgi:probable FeS assembly SUF system protein SufT
MKKELTLLTRDVMAFMVPSGARIMLHQGTEVTITQALGNAFTVNVFGNLARIDSKDADALGKEVHDPLQDLPADATLEEKIWAQLKTVYDPEIPVNIVDLGLVYDCDVQAESNNKFHVKIDMTLTAPGCGMGPVIAADAQHKVALIPEIDDVEVNLVFDPPWDRDKMSEAAKLELGLF